MVDISKLKSGDIVCHKGTGRRYIVLTTVTMMGGYAEALAVETMRVSNPSEWKLVKVHSK